MDTALAALTQLARELRPYLNWLRKAMRRNRGAGPHIPFRVGTLRDPNAAYANPRPPLPWSKIRAPARDSADDAHRWTVVLGSPGSGKSSMLWFEGMLTVREQIALLRDGRIAVSDVLLPIYAPAKSLSLPTVCGDHQRFLDVLFRLATAGCSVSEPLEGLIVDTIKRGNVVLLLDGLDEVASNEEYTVLLDRISVWKPSRVRIASRVAGFRGSPLKSTPIPFSFLEIVPLTEEEVKRCIARFPGLDDEARESLIKTVHADPALLALAQTRLDLRLICETARAGGTTKGLTRCKILHRCLDGHLGAPRDLPDESRGIKRVLLSRFAWRLCEPNLTCRTAFRPHVVLHAINAVRNEDPGLCEQLGWTTPKVVWRELKDDEILVDEEIGDQSAGRNQFRHKVFQEFLLAWALASFEDDEIWRKVENCLPTTLNGLKSWCCSRGCWSCATPPTH